MLYSLDAFNINSIPRNQNIDENILANVASRFMAPSDGFYVEMIFKPSMTDNIVNL
jgi:hypothetical protein